MTFRLMALLSIIVVGAAWAVDDTTVVLSPDDTTLVLDPVESAAGQQDNQLDSMPSVETGTAAEVVPTPAVAIADETVGSKKSSPPELKLDDRQLAIVRDAVARKRKAVIAGAVTLAAGALIDYALIMPQSEELDPLDIEGQLAIISPSILAFGLRVAGPSMAAMRTSEVADAWKRATDTRAPRNLAWSIYFAGWGFYLASGVCAGLTAIDSSVNWQAWSLANGIVSDVVWVGTIAYSWMYIMRIGHKAERAAVQPPKVSLIPYAGRSGAPGIALGVRF